MMNIVREQPFDFYGGGGSRLSQKLTFFINMLKYWIRLNEPMKNNLLKFCYRENLSMLSLFRANKPCWLNSTYKTLHRLGFEQFWFNLGGINTRKFIKIIRKALSEHFRKQLQLDIQNNNKTKNEGNKLRTYKIFKSEIKL